MFNFFNEVKENIKNSQTFDLNSFNIINVSGKLLYVEGHKGLITLSKELVSFRVEKSVVIVEGENMTLIELSDTTIKIGGKINKVEQV